MRAVKMKNLLEDMMIKVKIPTHEEEEFTKFWATLFKLLSFITKFSLKKF